ncbi:MAG: DMT family transporter [Actinobacteria bacterium]|nr:DMT family transporter [Actinomycetota bacterium]
MESLAREFRRRVLGRPTLAALTGALAIAFSGILYRYAEVSPETGAFFRCLFALPPLWLLTRREDAHLGPRGRRARWFAWGAGAFLAVDLLLWHHSIEAVGAGLATVLANMQVVLVGVMAWALLGERPAVRSLAAIPIAVAGIVLISGVLETDAYGDNPELGAVLGVSAGLAYSVFLLTLRHGSQDVRRVAGPLFDVTLAAAIVIVPAGLVAGTLDFMPPLESAAWLALLALTSQVVGWLLISVSLTRLPAVVTSILLTLQPVGSVLFAAALLDERPSILQLAGTAAILAGLVVASAGRGREHSTAQARAEAPAG